MEFLKPLLPFLPVLMFIAGYFLGGIDRFRESRRKLRNLKMILFKEMSENYKLLNKVVPQNEVPIRNPVLVAMLVQRFSFSVYDRYLDRLDQLRTNALSKIYEANVMMKGLQSDASVLVTAARVGEDTIQAHAQATMVLLQIHKCHELLTQAILLFPDGPSFIKAQDADRGSAFAMSAEISSAVEAE